MRFLFGFLVLCHAGLLQIVSGDLFGVFDKCCMEGVQWSSASYRCNNYPAPVVNVSDSDQAACLSIIEVCCIKQTQMVTCEDGKQTALIGDICAIRDMDPGAEQFRECCHCCQLGLVARSTQQSCQSPNLGQPCDSKYRECCLGEASDNSTLTDGLSNRDNHGSGSRVIGHGGQQADEGVNDDDDYLGTADKESSIKPRDTDSLGDDTSNNIDEDNTATEEEYDDILDNEDDNYDNIDVEEDTDENEEENIDENGNSDTDTEDENINNDGDDNDENDEIVDDEGEEDNGLDECRLFAGQVCSHLCVNTAKGFYCDCPVGMLLDKVDNRTCKIDENMEEQRCDLNNPCEQKCVDMEAGGIECRCWSGYILAEDNTSCQDIDECQERTAVCAPSQRCVNTRGSFTCMSARCPKGFELNPLTGQCDIASAGDCDVGFAFNHVTGHCEDINECGLGIDHCRTGARCENTIGSYACRRVRHCGTGYTLDESSQRCLDNNECLMGTDNCDRVGYDCQNTQGSFRCVPKSCNTGYKFDTTQGRCVVIECPAGLRPNDAGNCEDIDECTEYGPTTCKRHERCVNTRGSYHCESIVTCPPGYEPTDNSGCQDINECEAGTHKCGVEQQCVNRQGSYFCQCPRGLRHDHTGRCIDVDECAYGAAICPSNSKCVNTVGSFKCECIDGLVSDGNYSCTDVNECAQGDVCQQKCVNVLGTFFCSCNRGYQLRDDKRSCEDIDECTQFGGRPGRSGVCGGQCINMPGSYRCKCPEGWRLKPDGRSCQDVNECSEGTAYCPNTDSVCINTRGGYKCPIVRCPEGFLRTNSSRQRNSLRCRRMSVDCPECQRGLISRTFNFLSFASNVRVPAPLFSMTGSRLLNKFYTWDLNLVSARPLRAGISKADETNFRLEKSRDFARVTLLNRIDGPQDVILKLKMNVTSYYRGYEGSAESQIHLYITEEDHNV